MKKEVMTAKQKSNSNWLKTIKKPKTFWGWVLWFIIFALFSYFLTSWLNSNNDEYSFCIDDCVLDMNDCLYHLSYSKTIYNQKIYESDYESCFNDLKSCIKDCKYMYG